MSTAGLVFSASALAVEPSLHDQIPVTLDMEVSRQRVVNVEGTDITVHYYGRSTSSGVRTLSTVDDAIVHFLAYLDLLGINHSRQCLNLDLNIYELADEELNNRSLMSFLSWDRWGNRDLHGIYDSFNSRLGQGGIFFSGSIPSAHLKSSVIAHEVSHFMQEVYCISSGQESMSRDFERFFRDRTSPP